MNDIIMQHEMSLGENDVSLKFVELNFVTFMYWYKWFYFNVLLVVGKQHKDLRSDLCQWCIRFVKVRGPPSPINPAI